MSSPQCVTVGGKKQPLMTSDKKPAKECCCGSPIDCCLSEFAFGLPTYLSATGGVIRTGEGEAGYMEMYGGIGCSWLGSGPGNICPVGSTGVTLEADGSTGKCRWVITAYTLIQIGSEGSGPCRTIDGECVCLSVSIYIWATWVKDWDDGEPRGTYTFLTNGYIANQPSGSGETVDLDTVYFFSAPECSGSAGLIPRDWESWCGNPLDTSPFIVG